MQALINSVDQQSSNRAQDLNYVFIVVQDIERDLQSNLDSLVCPSLTTALKRKDFKATARTDRSTDDTAHYYRAQIMQNAEGAYAYRPAPWDHQSWIALNMKWNNRRARLVFTFHGIGRPFTGSVVCAPFWELSDVDEDNKVIPSVLKPIAHELFVAFYNEEITRALERFRPWRDEVVKSAILELSRNI